MVQTASLTVNQYEDTSSISLTGDQSVPSSSLFVITVTPDVAGHTLTVPNNQSHTIVNASGSNSFILATTGNSNVTVNAAGTVTVAWDNTSAAHVVVSQSSTVNVTSEDLIVTEYSPPRDNITSDHTAINQAFAAAASGLRGRLIFPYGDYYVDSSCVLPDVASGTARSRFEIVGYGAKINTMTTNVEIFTRKISDITGWTGTSRSMVPAIKGFTFVGQGANSATAGTGLRVDGTYGAIVEDCNFVNLQRGAWLVWAMGGKVDRCDSTGCLISYLATSGAYAAITNGTTSNSNCHLVTFEQCRAEVSNTASVGFVLNCANKARLQNCAVEGTNGLYGFWVQGHDGAGANYVTEQDIKFEGCWTELSSGHLGTVYLTEMWNSKVTLEGCVVPDTRTGTTPNEMVFFSDNSGLANQDNEYRFVDMNWRAWHGTTDPWFNNQTRTPGTKCAWIFESAAKNPSTVDFIDPSLWENDPNTSILLRGSSVRRGESFETFG